MLESFFKPKGVAVIGASRDPHKLGYGVVRNLIRYKFKGAIYPVNANATDILGLECYPSVSKVPDPVDLAVIVVPAAQVAEMITQCGKRGIRHVIVTSGGFAETGPEGRQKEQELKVIADKAGIRLIGPNCIGTIDTHSPLNSTFIMGMPATGEIGFTSQSGAMVAAVIDWSLGAGIGFSRIVSLGNQIDVNEREMIASMVSDPQTRVISAYVEGVSQGREFMAIAEEASRKKPVVVLKGGTGEGGAKAVASHTGSLAGRSDAYRAAFARSGVLMAETMEQLFDWARALAWQPLPRGNRIAVLTNAGGPAIMAVDTLEQNGLKLAPLTDETRAFLKPRLPAAGSINNPVDILAGSGPGTYAIALDALLSDPTVDAAVVISAPQDWFLPESLAEVIGEVSMVHKKPVLCSLMGHASIQKAVEILSQRKIPNFTFPERMGSTLKAMLDRARWLERGPVAAEALSGIDHLAAQHAVNHHHFKNLMKSYSIPIPPDHLVTTAKAAVSKANAVGYPVVLKLVSPDFTHKTEVGGVITHLQTPEAVSEAYDMIVKTVTLIKPDVRIEGILVQKMMDKGHELLVGVRHDPQFGPVIVVGSGGVEVELLKDVAVGIAPVNRQQAIELLASTLAGKRLNGWRSVKPGDWNAAIDVIVRLSQIGADFPEISELEINPLLVLEPGQGAWALDVRAVMG